MSERNASRKIGFASLPSGVRACVRTASNEFQSVEERKKIKQSLQEIRAIRNNPCVMRKKKTFRPFFHALRKFTFSGLSVEFDFPSVVCVQLGGGEQKMDGVDWVFTTKTRQMGFRQMDHCKAGINNEMTLLGLLGEMHARSKSERTHTDWRFRLGRHGPVNSERLTLNPVAQSHMDSHITPQIFACHLF